MIGSNQKLLMARAGVSADRSWDISYATYSGTSLSVGTGPRGMYFRDDGLAFFVMQGNSRLLKEYSLTTAWALSTASFVQDFNVLSQESTPFGLGFKPDGTAFFISGSSSDSVHEYSMSTAWDISTASLSQSFDVSAQSNNTRSLYFKPDGNALWLSNADNSNIVEYSLSTAWDISTLSYVQAVSFSAQETIPRGIYIRSDGVKLYVAGSGSDNVNEYSMSTPWDISTASFDQSFSVLSQQTDTAGFTFASTGRNFYIAGFGPSAVFQYDIG